MNAPCEIDAVARIGALARSLFPAGVAVAATDPRHDHGGLLPEELPAVARATERRRREFAAGRIAARRAMAGLGVFGAPVPSGPDRAPVWPAGIVGSIAHTATACLAVAARAGQVRALGIDLEPDAPLEAYLVAEICTPPEIAWLVARPEAARGRLARLIFSAKECAYKCRYPLTRTLLEFADMRIEIDAVAGAFTAVPRSRAAGLPEERFGGRWRSGAGHVLTGMML